MHTFFWKVIGIEWERRMKLYNVRTRSTETFTPLKKNNVKIYVCGITPYDTTHLGHAFTYVFFDTIINYLKSIGYSVNYTQNVTDIDDDILKRAKEEGRDWKELGDFWVRRFLSDLKALHVTMPTHYVKATESMQTIISLIEILLQKKHAYEVDGTVFFSVPSFPDYGELSRYSEEQMIQLSRERGADPDDVRKHHPLDFILWQRSLPNEPSWDSPFGKGRPGWHIECSAMIKQYLGDQIDIHGGGRDLIYPHHESEIAQSESATGKKPFVNFWMHTAMVMYEGEKMSKSLKNLVLVADLHKDYSAKAIRYVLLNHHYRTPWEFVESEVGEAEKHLKIIEEAVKKKSEKGEKISAVSFEKKFTNAMEDDMQTPEALKNVLSLAKKIAIEKGDISELQKELQRELSILGLIT